MAPEAEHPELDPQLRSIEEALAALGRLEQQAAPADLSRTVLAAISRARPAVHHTGRDVRATSGRRRPIWRAAAVAVGCFAVAIGLVVLLIQPSAPAPPRGRAVQAEPDYDLFLAGELFPDELLVGELDLLGEDVAALEASVSEPWIVPVFDPAENSM